MFWDFSIYLHSLYGRQVGKEAGIILKVCLIAYEILSVVGAVWISFPRLLPPSPPCLW